MSFLLLLHLYFKKRYPLLETFCFDKSCHSSHLYSYGLYTLTKQTFFSKPLTGRSEWCIGKFKYWFWINVLGSIVFNCSVPPDSFIWPATFWCQIWIYLEREDKEICILHSNMVKYTDLIFIYTDLI